MSKLSTIPQSLPQDLFTSSATQLMELGAYAETADGRGFRYCLMGGVAGVPGKLYQAAAEDTTNLENIQAAVSAINQTKVTTTGTGTITANQLSGATMVVTKGTGAGYTYRVKSNPAATGAAYTVYLEDSLIVALDTTSYLDFVINPYSAIIVNPTTASSSPVGACVYALPISTYGWIQTHGPVALLADGTVTVGTELCASNGTVGAVEPLAGVQTAIGYAMTGITSTEYGNVFLTID